MSTVASINTNFTATTGNLEKGTKRAEQVVGGFGKAARGLGSLALFDFGNAMKLGIATLGISAFANEVSSQLDDLGRVFDRSINVGIAPDQLQGLEFAGKLAGVGIEEMGTALTKMEKKIAEAAGGSKKANEVFERLNLSAKELKTLTPDEKIARLSDSLFKLSSHTDRIRNAQDIFGKSGARLLSMLSEGGDGIRKAVGDFNSLGGALSDLDFAIADMAGDSLVRLSTVWDNLKKNLTVGVAPSIIFVSEALIELARSAGLAAQGTNSAAQMHSNAIGFVGDWWNKSDEVFFGGLARVDRAIAGISKSQGWEDAAAFFDNVAKENEKLAAAAAGPFKASDIQDEKLAKINKDANDAAERLRQLRGIGAEMDNAETAAKKGKQVEPAAVEFGTAKAIEAINKASGATGVKDIAKKQFEAQKDGNKILGEINRKLDNKEIMEPAGIND